MSATTIEAPERHLPDPLMTIDEVSAFIRKPKKTLYVWRGNGKGPRAMKLGGDLRYRLSDVEAWLDAQYIDGEAA